MEKKVAIYCRVDKGGDYEMVKHILRLQEKHLTDFASAHGYSVFKVYSDIGYAGHDLTRPEFMQMLNDGKKRDFDAILVVNEKCLYRGNIANIPKMPVPVITPNCPSRGVIQYPVR